MYFDPVEFGKRMSELRKVRAMTQEEMAERPNISVSQVKKLENGNRNCSLDFLVELSSFFNVSTDYLLTGKDRVKVHERNRLLSVISEFSAIAQEL